MEALFREMAARLIDDPEARRLLGAVAARAGEFAAGIERHRLLHLWPCLGREGRVCSTAPTYEPVARRGWAALARAIQPDGRLGWVQQVSDQPDKVAANDTQFYGVGAFLLAATAISDLDGR